jgi:hypothetical protein
MIIIISLYLIIILIFYFLDKNIIKNKKELFSNNNIPLNIGNYLVIYFHLMGKSFLNGKDFYYKPKDIDFIRDLPSYIPYNKEIYNKLVINNYTIDEIKSEEKKIILVAMWTIINKRREDYWLILKPQIKEILDTTLRKNNLFKKVDSPVIHFRCSDTPFIRNGYYFFQKYKFFKDSLEDIKKKLNVEYNKVILLSCNFHKSTDKNSTACNIYAESLKTYLEDLGYIVDVKCSSNLDDFATMFYAPAVISTCSSFSFMAGFFSNGIFISEGHFESGNERRCNDCGEWLKSGYSIEHHNIEDYYNTENVIKLLYS